MIKLGMVSFSDGRKRVHESLCNYIEECAKKIKNICEIIGEIKVIEVTEIVYTPETARKAGEELLCAGVDGTIFNIPVFAFPNNVLITANMINNPFLLISPANGKMPGLGGVLAATNLLHQINIPAEKLWGELNSTSVKEKLLVFARAAHAYSRLKGQVYGLIGGRSIGMGTGAVNPDQWMKLFGVDVEHIDQLELFRRSENVEQNKVNQGMDWLEANLGSIEWDNNKLTKENLGKQIRYYLATKDLIKERELDFIGVKCHYELSEYYVAQCLAAALINDPYDWQGPKEPVVYSCEADSDGALTMQILKMISNKPVLFFDFRHYDKQSDVFVFCNCGAMSTWYAGRSNVPEENLNQVTLCPLLSKYGGGGAHVKYIAEPGEITCARLVRSGNNYKMQVFKGNFKEFSDEKLNETCPKWPHGFLEVTRDYNDIIDRYENNHVHAVAGNYINELKMVCKLLSIEFELLSE